MITEKTGQEIVKEMRNKAATKRIGLAARRAVLVN